MMIQQYEVREHRFPSANGRDTVYAKIYSPLAQPRGIVQISHGMAEHIGRYDEFMRYLCTQGFLACGNDHIGHGQTAPNQANLGYLAPKDGFDALVTDLHLFTIYMQGQYPGIPYFLLGHSMGSFAARLYLARYGQKLQGAVLSGTGSSRPVLPAAALVKKLAQGHGSQKPSRWLDKLAFGSFNRGVHKPKTPFDWLSRDGERVAAYITDPLCGFTFSASAFGDLFTGIYRCNKKEWFQQVPRELPILLVSGDQDPVGDYGRGVRKVYDRLRRSGVRHVQLKLYPGARHEVLNELNWQQVYGDVLDFLQQWAAVDKPEQT